MERKVRQLFEYLLALRNLSYEPIRQIKQYEKYWFIDELPEGVGCYLGGSGNDSHALIEIHQQKFMADYPTLSHSLEALFALLKFDYSKESSLACSFQELKDILDQEQKKLTEQLQSDDEMISLDKWGIFLLTHSAVSISKIEFEEKFQFVSSFVEALVQEYQAWHQKWQPWAVEQKRKRQIQKIYDYFFNLMQVFKSEEQSLEMMLGVGILTLEAKNPIHHPLLTIQLELDFDAENGVAKLLPSSRGFQLELEMLSDVELPNQTDIMQLREWVSGQLFNPFEGIVLEGILRQFIHYMHPNGQFLALGEEEIGHKYPVISQRHVLFVRKKSDVLLKEDLQLTLDYIEQGGKIPKTIQSLIGVEGLKLSKEEIKEWQGIGEQLLFPLPANEEQKDIARRLEQNIALTVQGPPGTGKSHTIVNLIAHLLSHGKRILVTSEKDKALRVLIDKLPEEVKSLCVSLLGGDRQSLDQIEQSIRIISEGLATYDSKILEKEIQVLSRQLDMVRRQIHLTKHNLVRFRELDAKGQLWKDKISQPYELAQLVCEKSDEYHWVQDRIEMNEKCPLTNEQFVSLWELKCQLPAKHKDILSYQLPMMSRIMSVEEYRHLLNEETGYLERIHSLEERAGVIILHEDRKLIDSLHEEVSNLVVRLSKLSGSLEQHILKECLLNEERYAVWKTIEQRLSDLLVRINEQELLIVNDEIRCDFFDHPKYDQMVQSLRDKIQANKTIGGLYLTFNKEIKAFYEQTLVNGHKLATLDDFKRLNLYKEKLELMKQFVSVWNKNMGISDDLVIQLSQIQNVFQHNQRLKQVRQVMEAVEKITQLNHSLKMNLKSINPIEYETLGELKMLLYSIELTQMKMKLNGWRDVYEVLMSKYKTMLLNEQMHPICPCLYESLVEKNHERFAKHLMSIQELIKIRDQYSEFYRLLNLLKVNMPLFANQMIKRIEVVEPIPGNFQDIFEYGKLTSFLNSLDDWKAEELELKLAMLEKEEVSVIKQLIFKMTWKNQLERVTPEEDRALQTWMQKMNRVGKGTGRHAGKYRREARSEMEKCQSAIPVWIMPMKEAIENFKVNPDLFDLVIIDESSQCNVLGLPILMRAKKAIIVGDDQQISPMMPGISDAQVNELMNRYLYNIENGNAYDLQTSLYDIACRVFSSKGKLMLKEHFRCVPEIIGFSNELCYRNEMIPLKLPLQSEQFNPPVKTVYVENATRDDKKTNLVEAKQIVSDIKQMIQDPQYAHKTMGVISLLGSEQAKVIQKLLLKEVGEQVMIERQIICGDAYSFQGDERDIMFLSFVVAPNMRYNALNKKLYTQRFNVAASRAKSQMLVYHSVRLEELSMEDLRYQFLRYCLNPIPQFKKMIHECETVLELDVMKEISRRGYQVSPKLSVGKYQIDLVVEGKRNRLAIECDGDMFYGIEKIEQDMERQRVLERAGWTFLRIRGSVFYRDKQQSLQPLWDKLEELEIKPNKKNLS